jgi:hypothetical protein
MLDLSHISLVCVESRNPKLAKFAIDQCLSHANFGECILLSEKRFELPSYITQVEIPAINSTQDYSQFMINELHKYFDLDIALIIQWDGFILSPDSWNDEFLKFDYIGAPWVDRGIVGNGGFSLRSKKLCQALAKMSVKETHPEDWVICTLLKQDLEEKYGISFPSLEIARLFAFESEKTDFKTFGFHAIQNFPLIFNDQEILEIINLGEKDFINSGHVLKLIRASYKLQRFGLAKSLLSLRKKSRNNQFEYFIILFRIIVRQFISKIRNQKTIIH